MSDDKSKTGKPDDSKINVHQKYELDYWTKALGVTPAKLVEVVKKVGPQVKDVKKELGK